VSERGAGRGDYQKDEHGKAVRGHCLSSGVIGQRREGPKAIKDLEKRFREERLGRRL